LRPKQIGVCVFIVLAFLAASAAVTVTANTVRADNPTLLAGMVIYAATGQPAGNSTVQVWDATSEYSSVWTLLNTVRTDATGHYSASVRAALRYRVYTFHDDLSTPGLDYVPVYQDILPGDTTNITHYMISGGTIVVGGDLRFVESSVPADAFTLTVVDPVTEQKLGGRSLVYTYGAKSLAHDFLRLNRSMVIAPADTPVDIQLNASVLIGSKTVTRTFRLAGTTSLVVSKGKEAYVRVEESLSLFNLDLVQARMGTDERALNEVEDKGFYVTLERSDLAKARLLVDQATGELADKSFDAAHSDLREAYLSSVEIGRRIDDMYANASSSVATLVFFVIMTAVALSSVLFEGSVIRVLGTCGLSGIFLGFLHATYPGVRLITLNTFLLYVGLALVIVFVASSLLSRLADQRFVSLFSMGRQNLKRRRLRYALTLISVSVLSMSFVTFTSFSTGYGLASSSFKASNNVPEGLLVRRPPPSDLTTAVGHVPLEQSTIEWLQGKSGVLAVAPKVENNPQLLSLATLSAPGGASEPLPLFGAIGIEPAAEASITHINETIVEGDYLGVQGGYSILISRKAADKLEVRPGDELLLTTGTSSSRIGLAGLLDDSGLAALMDVDGQSLLPKKLSMTILNPDDPPIIEVKQCNPAEIVIADWRMLQGILTGVSLSRTDAKLVDNALTPSIARQIALERDLAVWSSWDGNLNLVGLAEYSEAKGLSVMIPWVIVVLNVVITMLNSMFERRKEIAILSSVGLNPSHIGGIFLAEAAIIGASGGGLGYLMGLGGYRGMLALSIAVDVKQKVSAVWSLASVGVAVAAVLVGTAVALRSSVVVTPSLLRKWTRGEKIEGTGGQWEFQMPIRLHEEGVVALFDYLKRRIPEYVMSAYPSMDRAWIRSRMKETEGGSPSASFKILAFNYFLGHSDPLGSSPFSLIAEKKNGEETYSLRIICKGAEEGAIEKKVTFIRMLIVDWDARRK